MKSVMKIGLVAVAVILLAGCTPNISPNNYSAYNAGQSQRVQYGTVKNVQPVNVRGNNGGVGTLIGGATGAVAGSAIGGGTRANILGGIGGAVIGGLLGNVVGSHVGNQTGFQYIVRLNNGRSIAVVQGMDPMLHMGQHVMVLQGGGQRTRILPR